MIKVFKVYEAILIAMENYKNEMIANSMIWLLQYLYTKEVGQYYTDSIIS